MLNRYRMYRRGQGVFYAKDKTTGRAESLGTKDQAKAQRLLSAKNQAIDQSHLNVAMLMREAMAHLGHGS